MGIMGIVWMIVVGFVVGLLARFFYPGAIGLGFWMTTLLGIGGSVVGGAIGGLIWKSSDGKFHPGGIILSVDRRNDPSLGLAQFHEIAGRALRRFTPARRPNGGHAISDEPSSFAAASSSGRNVFSISAKVTREAWVPILIAATTAPAWSRTGTAIERRPISSS